MLIRFSMSTIKSRAERKYAADTPLSGLVISELRGGGGRARMHTGGVAFSMPCFPVGANSLTC
jgi:hypothetical protein